MDTFYQVLVFSAVGSIFSLIGGFVLLKSQKTAKAIAHFGAPFAAGTLLAAAFLDLLKESGDSGPTFALIGILFFFLLERFLSWFHHHHQHEEHEHRDPKVSMVIIGDTLHNFIDGMAIGAAFLVSPEAGIVASLAVAAHEIPQEIGDFGLLLSKGMDKRRVLLVNLISASAAIISALFIYSVGSQYELNTDPLLGLVAGMFIYIAVSDIIPEIHKKTSKRLANLSALLLILGVLLVGLVSSALHSKIDDHHQNHQLDSSPEYSEDEH